jgi:hypothetical protein
MAQFLPPFVNMKPKAKPTKQLENDAPKQSPLFDRTAKGQTQFRVTR